MANRPTEEVAQKYAVALDNAQTPQVATQDQEQQRKQNAPTMA
jgi:hypothetical protein